MIVLFLESLNSLWKNSFVTFRTFGYKFVKLICLMMKENVDCCILCRFKFEVEDLNSIFICLVVVFKITSFSSRKS